MLCIFTARAEDDLENIADYIAIDNPARAISFVQEIRNRSQRIALRASRLRASPGIRGKHPKSAVWQLPDIIHGT